MIDVQHVHLTIKNKTILKDITMTIESGQMIAIVGPNGAGKSSLLSVLAGDVRPTQGSVCFNGQYLREYKKIDLAKQQAVLPQFSGLTFDFPVRSVIEMGRAPWQGTETQSEEKKWVEMAADYAGISTLLNRRYRSLSGGESQRVHFARVLAQLFPIESTQEKHLLLDEPTASLDWKHAYNVLAKTRQLTQHGLTAVVVLHDLNLAATFADSVAVIANGQLIKCGPAWDVLTVGTLKDVFGLDVCITKHPEGNTPLIIPTYQTELNLTPSLKEIQ